MGRSWKSDVELIESRLGRPLPEGFSDAYHAEVLEAFERELEPVAGIAAALDAIELPWCVASSSAHPRIRASLTATGLLDRFEGRIFSSTDVEHGKPAPDLFLLAARDARRRAGALRRRRGRAGRGPGGARGGDGRARLRRADRRGAARGRARLHVDGRAARARHWFRSQIRRSPVSVSRSSKSSIASQ